MLELETAELCTEPYHFVMMLVNLSFALQTGMVSFVMHIQMPMIVWAWMEISPINSTKYLWESCYLIKLFYGFLQSKRQKV